MKEKLKEHIQALFADAERRSPDNQRLAELKEELLQNTLEKYDHMISVGKSPEGAYAAAVNGIGDITELLNDVIGGSVAEEGDGTPVSFVPCAETAGNDGAGEAPEADEAEAEDEADEAPEADEAEAEDEADEADENSETRPRRSRWYGLVSGIIWTVILLAYFAVSFTTHAWSVTWLIFIMGIAADNVAMGFFDLRR